jgi:hypothetical protein
MTAIDHFEHVIPHRSVLVAAFAGVLCMSTACGFADTDQTPGGVGMQLNELPEVVAQVGKLIERVEPARRAVQSARRRVEDAQRVRSELEAKLRDAPAARRTPALRDFEIADARLTAARTALINQEGLLRPLEERLSALTSLRDVGLQVATLIKRREQQQLDARRLEIESDKTRQALLEAEVELIAARELREALRRLHEQEPAKSRDEIPAAPTKDGDRARGTNDADLKRVQQKVTGLETSTKDLRRKWNQLGLQFTEKQNQLLETDIASVSRLKAFRANHRLIRMRFPDN